MITFPALGTYGRLGNQLFQMAATIGLALDHNDHFGFPRWQYENCFPIKDCFFEHLPEGPEYLESQFSYHPIPYQENLRIKGFFQSEKYFERHAMLIHSLFMPSLLPKESPRPDAVSLHVRRGDYMLLPDHHPILEMSYYDRAVEFLRKRGATKFLVFSDDLPWCRDHFSGPLFEVIPDLSPIEQLALTISCTHHIMANSTFSWWGAWLDQKPGRIVIAPQLWFGPGYAHYDTKDLFPSDWTIL